MESPTGQKVSLLVQVAFLNTPVSGQSAWRPKRKLLMSGAVSTASRLVCGRWFTEHPSTVADAKSTGSTIAGENKSGLYRQCAGAGKSGTRQTARAGALSIRPVVLKPRWFGMAIAFWRIDQNEAEMFRRAEPARSDCGAPGIPGEWLGTTALCRLTGPVNVKIIANRVVRVLPRAASNREIPVRAHG